MADVALHRLSKRYADHAAVSDVDLDIRSGEFVSLLGPSGCGKSTLLRMLAGLIEPSDGMIVLDGADITRLPAHRRGLGLVFQSYALFPHLSVADNVAFGLRRQGVRGQELRSRTNDALALVRLGNLGERMPRQLSGGQQQRVALARAVAPRPRVLLLDEPLSNLDALLRDEMQIEIKRLQRELGITSIFVTHDQTEALSLSDRVCVLAQGRVQQVGTPEEVYARPANGFVAGFIGRSNRLRGRVDVADATGALLRLPDGATLRSLHATAAPGAEVDIVIRSDTISLTPNSDFGNRAEDGGLPGRVALRSFSGSRVQLVVRLVSGTELVVETATMLPQAALQPGAEVRAVVPPEAVFVAEAGA
jgi:ABC-type Fe3+/spermidine/putrescine transport system ATPase subunit